VFCDSKKEANDLVVESSIQQAIAAVENHFFTSKCQDCQVLHGDIIQTQRESYELLYIFKLQVNLS
jgi:hypothetical protein